MNIGLSNSQLEFMRRQGEPLLILSGGVGSGKSFVGSWAVARYFSEGKRILLGAQDYKALTRVMATEVMRRLDEIGLYYEYRKSESTIVGENGAIIYLYTGENPKGILGLSDISVLAIDECGRVPEEAYTWARDRQRGPRVDKAHVLLFTSPDSFHAQYAWFRRLCEQHPEAVIYANSLDNKFSGEEFKKALLERYPPGTPLYRQQVEGRFVDVDARNVIVRASEMAKCENRMLPVGSVFLGFDLAGAGADSSIIVARNNRRILEVAVNLDGSVEGDQRLLSSMFTKWNPAGIAWDDTGGYGRGIHTTAKSMPATGINFGMADPVDETVLNYRAGMYMRFRERMLGGFFVDTEMYPKISEEIRATTYTISQGGRLAIVSKDTIRDALGRSPDTLDALVLSFEAERLYGDGGGAAHDADYYRRLVAGIR